MTIPLEAAVFAFSEEILVLLLEDERGTLIPIPHTNIECALAGAVLMDLAFANRIDTDLETLKVTDRTPTGNPILDRTIAKIGAREETSDTRTWIKMLAAEDADHIREQALVGLVQHGILERQDRSFIWAFGPRRSILDWRERRFFRASSARRYRKAEREIKLRVGNVLLSDDIPGPRDVALIGLVDACDLLGDIFPDRTIDRLRPRVEQLRKMDLIGRELAGAIFGHRAQREDGPLGCALLKGRRAAPPAGTGTEQEPVEAGLDRRAQPPER